MSISSHLGIVLLVIVGVVTTIGVIAIAAIEARRMDSELPPLPPQVTELPAAKKRK